MLFLSIPLFLFAEVDPHTVYTKDRFFVTTGEIDLQKSIDEVSIALLKYNEYSQWALNGMQGIDKESEGLIAYFTEINYLAESNLFLITFDLNLIWPFGRKGVELKFSPHQEYSETGQLKSIKMNPLLGTKLVQEANLEFSLKEDRNGVSIVYNSRIKLSEFVDFFFSLRSYKKNFEWYVYKVADNLSLYLEGK